MPAAPSAMSYLLRGCFNFAKAFKVDLLTALTLKSEFNTTRERLHGGKALLGKSSAKIGRCFLRCLRIISEVAESTVAPAAQKTTYFARLVAVVDV